MVCPRDEVHKWDSPRTPNFLVLNTQREMFIIEKNPFPLMWSFVIKNDIASGKCKNLKGLRWSIWLDRKRRKEEINFWKCIRMLFLITCLILGVTFSKFFLCISFVFCIQNVNMSKTSVARCSARLEALRSCPDCYMFWLSLKFFYY